MKAVIMAGGKGTRISSIAKDIPKPMIRINGAPVLETQIRLAKRYGIDEILIVTGYLGEAVRAYFGDGERFGVAIEYYQEEAPLGNAGALSRLRESLREDFFLFYGDTVMDVALDRMMRFHKERRADATLYVHPNDHPFDSDLVLLGTDGAVSGFLNKPHAEGLVARNLVNAALYALSPRVLGEFGADGPKSFEKDVFPACIRDGLRVFGYQGAEYIKDMGTPDRYERVCADAAMGKVARLNANERQRAVFLDRDGTVNREVGLCHRIEDFRLLDGASEAIRLLNLAGIPVVVVTNQPVIARNLCSVEELERIHAYMETLLGRDGAYVDAVYYCPHHPDKGYPEERKEYKIACDCRKPKPGMLLKAASDYNIDLPSSCMIGDGENDVAAGAAAGIGRAVRIPQNEPGALLGAVRRLLDDYFANPV